MYTMYFSSVSWDPMTLTKNKFHFKRTYFENGTDIVVKLLIG